MNARIKKLLILTVVLYSCIFGLILIGVTMGFVSTGTQMYVFLPVGNTGLEAIILFLLIFPLSTIFGVIVGQYVIAPLYILAHKTILGKKMEYGLMEITEKSDKKRRYDFIFPTFIAVNFNLFILSIMTQTVVETFLVKNLWQNGVGPYAIFDAFLVLFMFTLIIAMALYSPVWFFLDAGIVFSNKKKIQKTRDPLEIRSLGNWYRTLLRGYAGIAVIFAYLDFLAITYLKFRYESDQGFIFTAIIIPIIPIIIALTLLLSILFIELTQKRRKKFMLNLAKKFGIKEVMAVGIQIHEMNQGIS